MVKDNDLEKSNREKKDFNIGRGRGALPKTPVSTTTWIMTQGKLIISSSGH
jgi:hypothetical protein